MCLSSCLRCSDTNNDYFISINTRCFVNDCRWLERTDASTYTLDSDDWEIDLFAQTTQLVKTKVNSWLPTVMASKPTAFMTLAMSSPLELFEIGSPWNESPESKTRVVPFERESFTIPDKRASPITPLRSSSTIRP